MNTNMKRVAVYCGSSSGNDPVFAETAKAVGAFLARSGYGVVYGGSRVGLMGCVADGALSAGGEVIGVLPDFLQTREIMHEGLTQLHIVQSMHERKLMMSDLSDGIITLPGGFGTLEELFEIITWAQLGLHTKPIALLNIQGFYDHLLLLLEHIVEKGLLKSANFGLLLTADTIDELLARMLNYVPRPVEKWITPART